MHVKHKLILCLRKKNCKYVRNLKVIPLKLQHKLVVVDLHKSVLKEIGRKKFKDE